MIAPHSPEARDIANHLHGYTNAQKHLELGPLIIERGEGIHVFDREGNRYIEALSGLWSVAVGFGEKRLVDAATKQLNKLPFYHTFGHKSHGPAVDLAEKLASMCPVKMSKVFLANSGSEANDTAIKMIWYRSNSIGQHERKKIISRNRAYHGVTIGSGSLTGLPANHASFDLPIPGILHTGSPHYWRDAKPEETEVEFSERRAKELEELIVSEGPETIAAFFAEPVMGAGGVIVPPAGYWEKIQEVLNRYDILLVADEVICGFGRTGRMFGCETFEIKPDIMVMSKALSSSYIPISALVINEKVAAPIIEESDRVGTFGHGFTGGGHPVAAAVALESIAVIEDNNLVENAARVGEHLQAGLRALNDHPLVGEVRGIGLIGAIELVTDKKTRTGLGRPGDLGAMASKALLSNGVITRNLGDAIAFCPPLVISEDEVGNLLSIVGSTLDQMQKELQRGGQI